MSVFGCLIDSKSLPKHNTRLDIVSPVSGKVTELDTLSNALYKQRLFGEGAAIETSGFQIFAPFDGKISEFPQTYHRIRVRHKNGLTIQIQCGIGAELLHGEGFRSKLVQGQMVKQGDVLLEFDIRKLRQALDCPTFAVTIINSEKTRGVLLGARQVTAGEDILFSVFI